MPQYNTTVEDFSPIITYSSGWSAGSSTDKLADLYSDSSFTLTSTGGETATFSFNGTSFTIFGSKRNNHGSYQITVDGSLFPPQSGQSPDPGQFQVPLFTSPPLNQGLHVVTLTNQGTTFVDIDFITFQSSVGTDDEKLNVMTVQDSDPAFVYTPLNEWGLNPPNLGTYSGSSGHGTATPGASMTYTFEIRNSWMSNNRPVGDGVTLYGPVGPSGSPFSVSLDGLPAVNYTANKQFYRSRVPLYIASDVGPGQHVLKVSYLPSQPGQIFAVDYADVYTSPSVQQLTSKNSPNGTTGKSLSGAAIAGIVISLLFILVILAGLLFFLRRRKSRKNNRGSLEAPMVQQSMGNRDIVAAPVTYPFVSAQASRQSYSSSAVGSYYANAAPNAMAVDTRSYVPSASSDSEYSPTIGVRRTYSISSSQQSSNPPLPFPKNTPLPLPPTASQSLAHVPTAQLRANRRVVPGRAQDFGPAGAGGAAPPNYMQATEPYGPV
ncbi:hypothetical protein C8R45DRAFT_1127142 [Mycena sanguinolenta]|nr:hypothetical protein C8R45DRAFT_1127142 [Mycena sanguinolenta]